MLRGRGNGGEGRPCLSPSLAAEVFGLSRSTFWRRVKSGALTGLRHRPFTTGWRFDMYDVFQAAYPDSERATLSLLIRDFRAKKAGRRGFYV